MPSPRPTALVLVAAMVPLGLFGLGRVAVAQEVFELSEGDDRWVELETADPSTPAGQLAIGRRALASGDDRRAEFLASEWIERHGEHPLAAEAYLLRGDALRARGDYFLALFDYEYIARQYAGSEVFVTALERELEIAQLFATGTKRRLMGMRIVDTSDEAEELLIRIQERLPGSRLAEQAGMMLGDFYFSRRQMDLAAEMYTLYIENYPRAESIRKARKRLIYAQLAAFKGPEFDATGLYEARTRLRALKATDAVMAEQIGADALLTRIDESDARKLFVTAKWYLATKDYIATELTIRRLVRTYPNSVATADALRIIPEVVANLPAQVLADGPNYDAMRAAILGANVSP